MSSDSVGVSRRRGRCSWPYLSSNIQEFWTRWHITLSSWVRDYVFLPLGHALFHTRLRRDPLMIAGVGYFSSLLIIGAWHGLAPNFLVWGAYHGTLLTAYHAFRTHTRSAVRFSGFYRSPVSRIAGIIITFGLVSVGWVPFMTTLPDAWRLLRLMFGAA